MTVNPIPEIMTVQRIRSQANYNSLMNKNKWNTNSKCVGESFINRFYSSAIWVRYVGWVLFGLFSGLALGSRVAILPMVLLAVLILGHTIIEDRMLHTDLKGYVAIDADDIESVGRSARP